MAGKMAIIVAALGLSISWGSLRASPPEDKAILQALVELPGIRRPEWLDMLAGILSGEGLEEGKGWYQPSAGLHGWKWLRDRFDADRDGRIQPAEVHPVREHFERLDRNEDGAITQDDLGGPELPEPPPLVKGLFGRLDTDRNDRVSWDELSWFFQQSDRRKRGFITRRDLAAALAGFTPGEEAPEGALSGAGEDETRNLSRWTLLRLFLTRKLGSFGEGPALGAEAPDFTLPSLEDGEAVRLSSSRGKRPVVLIFGGFT